MKLYELKKSTGEIESKDLIYVGCTLDLPFYNSETIAESETIEQLLDLLKNKDSTAVYMPSPVPYYLVEEYYIEENEYNENGEWVSGGDIHAFSEIIFF